MNFLSQLQILKRMDHLIRRKATGCPAVFASKLNVSDATLYRYMDVLKQFGAPVKYSKLRGSYIYEERFELKFDELV